jgi:hypothetical protein
MFREGVTTLSIVVSNKLSLTGFTGSGKVLPLVVVANTAEGRSKGREEGSSGALFLSGPINRTVMPENFWLHSAAKVVKFPKTNSIFTIFIFPTFHIITTDQHAFVTDASFICLALRIGCAFELGLGFRYSLALSLDTLETCWAVHVITGVFRQAITIVTNKAW